MEKIEKYEPRVISIHALREEGDGLTSPTTPPIPYFYPRPPRGGRLFQCRSLIAGHEISIHALREEGDMIRLYFQQRQLLFLSTPSARRATAKTEKNISAFVSL